MNFGERDYIRIAMANYANPHCITIDEFESDLNRVSLVKKMLTQLNNGHSVADRLLLNHLVLLFNVFENVTCFLLTVRIPESDWPLLFAYITALDRLPERIELNSIDTTKYKIDPVQLERIRKIIR